MNYKTIKVKGIGEVPIIGYIDSSTEKVHFYREGEELSNFRSKQAKNKDLLGKVAIKKERSQDNQQSLFSKI